MGDWEAIGFVARPVQQDPNRSVGVVIKQLRQRCYGGSEDIYGNRITEDKECCSNIEHCEGVMQANIDDDYSTFGSDPIALNNEECVSGDLLSLLGVPADLSRWKKLAGMDKYVEFKSVDDTAFCDDLLAGIDEEDEEGHGVDDDL